MQEQVLVAAVEPTATSTMPAPTVTLTAPVPSGSPTRTATATATNTNGYIETVKFSYSNDGADWEPIGNNTSSSGNSYYIKNWNTRDVPNGTNYLFKAEAIDNYSETADDTSNATVTIANILTKNILQVFTSVRS